MEAWRCLSVYDIDSKERISSLVAPENEYYWDAVWAEHDSNIYIELGVKQKYDLYRGIFRYDYHSLVTVPTPLKTLNISPDGKYSFIEDDGRGNIGLFSTSTGNEIRFVLPDKILKLNYVRNQGNYRYWTHSLKHLTWIIEGGKTYAILYNWTSSPVLTKMGISGFWKLDCETGISTELTAPKGISTRVSKNDYKMPAGLENGKLIWAIPNDSGGLKASALNQ
jgi:hypothetical protein